MIYESLIWSLMPSSGTQNKFIYEEYTFSHAFPWIMSMFHSLRIQFFHWNLLICLSIIKILKNTISYRRYCFIQNIVYHGWWWAAPQTPEVFTNHTHFQIYKCTFEDSEWRERENWCKKCISLVFKLARKLNVLQ